VPSDPASVALSKGVKAIGLVLTSLLTSLLSDVCKVVLEPYSPLLEQFVHGSPRVGRRPQSEIELTQRYNHLEDDETSKQLIPPVIARSVRRAPKGIQSGATVSPTSEERIEDYRGQAVVERQNRKSS
jgi:hypothetical protein